MKPVRHASFNWKKQAGYFVSILRIRNRLE